MCNCYAGRRSLQISEGVQATYMINSTFRQAGGIVQSLNDTVSNEGFRENLYNQGVSSSQLCLQQDSSKFYCV